ncbi:hypothetical protein F52700_11299 [Fusarium sp. NRRL 52700]|nr:hypothetical protein F52700_11299 [Fusarium sp. NRRL 52700]
MPARLPDVSGLLALLDRFRTPKRSGLPGGSATKEEIAFAEKDSPIKGEYIAPGPWPDFSSPPPPPLLLLPLFLHSLLLPPPPPPLPSALGSARGGSASSPPPPPLHRGCVGVVLQPLEPDERQKSPFGSPKNRQKLLLRDFAQCFSKTAPFMIEPLCENQRNNPRTRYSLDALPNVMPYLSNHGLLPQWPLLRILCYCFRNGSQRHFTVETANPLSLRSRRGTESKFSSQIHGAVVLPLHTPYRFIFTAPINLYPF